LECFLGIPRLNQIHRDASARCRAGAESFWRACVRVMDLRLSIAPSDLLRIPARGPVVVVANHPFGAIEAILLMDLLGSLRPDVKVMGNGLLCRMPCAAADVIAVDVEDGPQASRRNAAAAKAALGWLRGGGMLLVFPSGTVSHLHLRRMTVTDPPWNSGACALALKTCAPVLPIHIAGRNRWSFHLAGLLHPRLRTLLLVREMAAQLGRTVTAGVGQPVPATRLRRFPSAQAASEFLRIQSYALQGRLSPRPSPGTGVVPAPLATPECPEALRAEIEALPPRCTLVREGTWSVLAATAPLIPRASREIARLREMTFRLAGEGTGRESDWDRYDPHYLHLILWDGAAGRIAGGYRLGRADWIMDEHGLDGLYTRPLFRYDARFVHGLGHALELGRSFIRPECQRQALPLSLLWRGIGEWLVRHPRYHTLFGPVSISGDYHEISRNLMVQFLRRRVGGLGRRLRMRPARPHRGSWMPGLGLDPAGARLPSIEDLSAVVASIEDDGKGVPVLLRHYLKLNARMAAFNIDPDFAGALDGLVVLDLRRSDPKLLQRFMGAEGWRAYARFHGLAPAGGVEIPFHDAAPAPTFRNAAAV
jgi:putative hemolysin